MRRAFCLIRHQPHYRRDAFMAGLKEAGLDARLGAPTAIERGDVVLIWNRYGENDQLACRVEAAGGMVLVAENGYVGPGGISPHAMDPREIYALAIGGHNGSGRWHWGGAERWDALGVTLQPWRAAGDHILVCPNRSFGRPDLIMPPEWGAHVCKRLARITKRPIRLRPHPGNDQPKVPLARDLEHCHAVVIWSSSAGVQALIAGVPVISEAPRWICEDAAFTGIDSVEPLRLCAENGDALLRYRAAALRRLAWAQWHVNEIATGEPIGRLLEIQFSAVAA